MIYSIRYKRSDLIKRKMDSLERGWTLLNGIVHIEQDGSFAKIDLENQKKDKHISLFYGPNSLSKKFNVPGWYFNPRNRGLVCGNVTIRHGERIKCFVNFNVKFFLPHENDNRRDFNQSPYRFLACPAVVLKLPDFKAHVSLGRVQNAKNDINFDQYLKNYDSWFEDDLSGSFSSMSLSSVSKETKTARHPKYNVTYLRKYANTDEDWTGHYVKNGEKVTKLFESGIFSKIEHNGEKGFIRTNYLFAKVGGDGYTFN